MRGRSLLGLILLGGLIPACSGSHPGDGFGPAPEVAGDYFRVGYSASQSLSQDTGRAGTITSSSAGTYADSMTVNVNGAISSSAASGTFTASPGGPFSWSETSGPLFTGGFDASGDLGLSGSVGAGTAPALFVDVRKGGASFDNTTLLGTYFNVSFAFHPSASPFHYTISGLLNFDGVGGWTTTMTSNREGTIVTGVTNTGTYSVASDGTASLSDPGTIFLGAVLRGGDLLLLGTFGPAARTEIILCARKGGTFTAATLQGTYRVIAFGSTPTGHNHFASVGTCAFDGVGSVTWTGSQNTEGTVTSLNGMTETYSITSDGTLTLVNSSIGTGLTLAGGAVSGGRLAVVSAVTAGNRLETRIFMKD